MKKTILSFAFIVAGIFAFNASAQQPANAPACCQNGATSECCQLAKPGQKPKAPKLNPFEGITLTAEQQASIDKLNEKIKQERVDAKKDRAENAKKARKAGKDAKKEYLNELKKILTPEQYTTYLENMVTTVPNKPGKEMRKGDRKMPQDIRKGERKGNRKDAVKDKQSMRKADKKMKKDAKAV